MRKFILAFLLPVILLLSQQGAVTHEIGHIADFVARAQGGTGADVRHPTADESSRAAQDTPTSRGAQADPHPTGDLQCQACLAFAHLAGAVTAHVLPPTSPGFSFHFAVRQAPAFIAADAPSARSRGPPFLL